MSGPESGGSTRLVIRDRLSSLPDELLHHVMSFMPAWQAVQLCVLSRRWRALWTTMPDINFDFHNFWNKPVHNSLITATRILEFVEKVILLHKTPSCLRTFRLNCHFGHILWSYHLSVSIMPWIRYAVKHNLQALTINIMNFRGLDPILLPPEVFTSPCLEHVTFSFWGLVNTPEIINLPSLKQLHLNYATFTQDFVSKLLGGCPVLEDLHVRFCRKEFSVIISHSLKHLRIMTDHICGSIELIDCPNLLSFHLRICLCCLKNGIILNMPSLSEACIEIDHHPGYVPYVTKSNILCGLFNVCCLEIRGTSTQDFLKAEISSCKTFSKLTCLSVGYICLVCSSNLLSSLLEHCPSLRKLSLFHDGCICKKQPMWSKRKKEVKFRCEQLETVEVEFLFEDSTSKWVVKCLQEAVSGLCNVRVIKPVITQPSR